MFRSKASWLLRQLERIIISRYFLIAIFVWFGLQCIYIATTTSIGIAPDELYHIAYINLFTNNGWVPIISSQEGYYFLGEVQKTPYFLYHYLLSIPNHLFINYEHSEYILRLLNIPIALGSLYFTYLIAKQARLSKLAINISVFMLANTLMFTFLSSSVNYDNLFVLVSLASVYTTLLLLEKFSLNRLLLIIILLLAGSLTKVNFLPIATILILVLIYSYWKNKTFPLLINEVRKSIKNLNFLSILLSIIVLILSIVFVQKYVFNIAQYQSPSPSCDKVLPIDKCLENSVFARNQDLKESATIPATKPVFEYISDWYVLMNQRTYGIFGANTIEPVQPVFVTSQLFLVLALIALIRKIKWRDKIIIVLLSITVFYLLILLLDNQFRYQEFGIFTFAVQGRYLFAILPLIYIIGNYYIMKYLKIKQFAQVFAIYIIVIFSIASLPAYIYGTGDDWHNNVGDKVNKTLKDSIETIKPY